MPTKIIAYQQRVKAELADAILNYKRSSSEIVLSAPTGSGKTTIAYLALKEVYDRLEAHSTLPLFVWVSVGNLAMQSLADFQKKTAGQPFYKLVSSEDVVGDRVDENAMLFINWQRIVGDDVLLRKDNEKGRTFSGWMNQAKTAGRLVVFLIDEFHLHTDADGAQNLLALAQPDKTVYLSATPKVVPGSQVISVSADEVVAEGVIRKSLVVNPNDHRISSMLTDKNLEANVRLNVEGLMSPSTMLEEGLKLQSLLEQAYRKEGVGLTPLAIVQLPNSAAGDALYRELNQTLSTLGLKEGEIAVSMSYEGSDVQTNFQNISSWSSPIKVVFFKQKLATGWDCPRAQILVKCRDSASETFSLQVLGRIVRHVEMRHYDTELLNYGYVFTDAQNLKIDRDVSKFFVGLPASLEHTLRGYRFPFFREFHESMEARHSISRDAYAYVPGVLRELSDDFSLKTHTSLQSILDFELKMKVLDEVDPRINAAKTSLTQPPLEYLTYVTEQTAREVARPYAGGSRENVAYGVLVEIARQLLRIEPHETSLEHNETAILTAIAANQHEFVTLAGRVLERHTATFGQRMRRLNHAQDWELPPMRSTSVRRIQQVAKLGLKKFAYAPAFADFFEEKGPERDFALWLDAHDPVRFWTKNGDNGQEHFSISYEHENQTRLFFPDFMGELACESDTAQPGTQGTGEAAPRKWFVLDTKGASNDAGNPLNTGASSETAAKAMALRAWSDRMRDNGVAVVVGIVVWDKKTNSWLFHSGKDYAGPGSLTAVDGWCSLKDVLSAGA